MLVNPPGLRSSGGGWSLDGLKTVVMTRSLSDRHQIERDRRSTDTRERKVLAAASSQPLVLAPSVQGRMSPGVGVAGVRV
jgi:hypothetical protein